MMPMPIAKTHDAASKGATGPRLKLPTSVLATSPAKMATSPFPKKMAFENVKDNHWASNPLCQKHTEKRLIVRVSLTTHKYTRKECTSLY
jgi:hypothetical protein